jgi:Protein of unknown function (DUF3040)
VDEDPVLHSLAADLEQDDPRLAALLTDGLRVRRHHPVAWLLLGLPLTALVLAVTLPPMVVLGIAGLLLVVSSPLAVCWLCSISDDVPRPRTP